MQLPENLHFQRKIWVAERVGWAILAALVVAAALGLFGKGLLGDVQAAAPDQSFRIEYRRFDRTRSPSSLRVVLGPNADGGDRVRVWVSSAYLDRFSIDAVQPEPERVELGADRIGFVFVRAGTEGEAAVRFLLEAREAGMARGEVRVGEGAGLVVRHFFYP